MLWQPDPHNQPRTQKVTTVVIHWWGDPNVPGTVQSTANYLYNSELSVHYVLSDTTIIKMVEEDRIAYHAAGANPFSVGIECDPRMPGQSYQTAALLVADICKRQGLDPRVAVKPHNQFFNTACPGTVNWSKIANDAYSIMQGGSTTLPYSDEQYNTLKADRDKFAEDWARQRYLLAGAKADSITRDDRRFRLHLNYEEVNHDLNRDLPIPPNFTPYELKQQVDALKVELGKKVDVDPDSIVITRTGFAGLFDKIKALFK